MSLTTPRTFVTGEVETAAIFNSALRDNLNALQPQAATIATQETTATTTFTDLATVGPSVTLTTGTSVYCTISTGVCANNTSGDGAKIGVAVSGATTLTAAANTVAIVQMLTAAISQQVPLCNSFVISGLTAGSNTFKLQYAAVLGGTALWANRTIVVEAPY